jgi:hypothetical protein
MEMSGINNNFLINNYSKQAVQNTYSNSQFPAVQNTYSKNQFPAVQNTYSNSQFPAVPVKNTAEQIFATDRSLTLLTDALEKKVNDFQAIGNLTGLQDKGLEDFKNLINKLSSLRENLNLDNLGQTLIDLKSLGNNNYALRQKLLNMQELRENEQSVAIRSYMFSLYDKVYEKKMQSLGIDVYY